MTITEILSRCEEFCQRVIKDFPGEKDFIRDKVLAFLADEQNREKLWNVIRKNFSLEKNEKEEIVVHSSHYSCGEDLPCHDFIIGKDGIRIETFGEEK